MAGPEATDRPQKIKKQFYRKAFTEAEREILAEAEQLEALSEEIAALRVRLFKTLKDNEKDLKLALYGMNTLMRMVVAEYRLSPRASKHLADHMTALLNDLGDQILPADR
jgi:hypothetical protein